VSNFSNYPTVQKVVGTTQLMFRHGDISNEINDTSIHFSLMERAKKKICSIFCFEVIVLAEKTYFMGLYLRHKIT
jgi:hypothetical protein